MLVDVALSKSQLDKLGDRLRNAQVPNAEDRTAYVEYRDTHYDPLADIVSQVEQITGVEPSSRLKRLESVVEKLRRQPGRLSRIADIAGCRIRVASLLEQQTAVDQLQAAFSGARVRDYRDAPQFGYRAVHIIVLAGGARSVEIQLRTVPQNMWANLSESVARAIDIRFKYGGGPEPVRRGLGRLSVHAAALDELILQSKMKRLAADRDLQRLEEDIVSSFESFHSESVTLLLGARDESLPD